jgi:chemotaxis protein MotB
MTTLLMTAFILWYSLTAMKLPQELLVIGSHTRIQQAKGMAPKEEEERKAPGQDYVFQSFKMTPQQESAIQEIKALAEVEKEFRKHLASMQIEDSVEMETGIDAIIVTPRAPLLFSEGSATLKGEGLGFLDKITQVLHGIPYYQVRVEGHTDAKPISPFHRYRYPSNWELSYARAVSIAKYFIQKGVPPERMGVAGYGDSKPRVPNDTEEHRARNRRVEIYISFYKPSKGAKSPQAAGQGAEGNMADHK